MAVIANGTGAAKGAGTLFEGSLPVGLDSLLFAIGLAR